MTAAELAAVGVAPVGKTLHVDLAQAGYAGVEKVEGLALLDSGQLALINDNDFGVAQIVIDNATGRFTLAPGYVPEVSVLGIVNVPGLDASDRDNAINIRTWPVFGMYEPDAIASFEIGHRQLPDHRQRRRRARLAGLRGRGARRLADAGSRRRSRTARRSRATATSAASTSRSTLGDTDGDGDFDAALHARRPLVLDLDRPRARWSSTAAATSSASSPRATRRSSTPATTTAPSTAAPTTRDRSRKRSTIGTIGKRTYAFIGLERMGGIMVYDVTNPIAPVFVDYVNNRDFTVDPRDRRGREGSRAGRRDLHRRQGQPDARAAAGGRERGQRHGDAVLGD